VFLLSIYQNIRAYWRYRRCLIELSKLDDKTLRDVGMSRSEAYARAWQETRP
jgi:uncharacterized protein YjiS (DUF1127 family)